MKYADSGVNIDAATNALARSKESIRSTWDARVKNEMGAFGGLFQAAPGEPLLVASVDGVGTKVMIARMAGCYNTVGQDLVNHCVDDILVQGAEPLFFLDYFATSKLADDVLPAIIEGFAIGCRENGAALLGGETAEMPGVYSTGEFDLAGTIVGRVREEDVIDGSRIAAGDKVWGLPSTGLHTNGYSLARAVLFDKAGYTVTDTPAELAGVSVGDALLAVHRSYLNPVRAMWAEFGRDAIRGLCHITGGGFYDNIPRVIPDGLCVNIDPSAWTPLPIFQLIAEKGGVDSSEMYRVFNMGIGLVVITPAEVDLSGIDGAGAVRIGEVTAGDQKVKLPF
ncbi:MAG: phosphoribosylformylglycinamidine cyclo-ligase [Candidatus Krumholzibacteria bacterium]|nr:phosphoribosylformylglycinamidine cyclo-ligase [Candidatus Krumholzibacteria bacterium]